MIALFDRFVIEMSREQAESVSHPGECYDDCVVLVKELQPQLDLIPPELIREELSFWADWNVSELSDDSENLIKIVWIAGCNIIEEEKNV